MKKVLRKVFALAAVALATQVYAQVTLYEYDNFEGRLFTTERQVNNLTNTGFNDRASSILVKGERWEVCDDARFSGRCIVLRPGRYASLSVMGLNDRISSVRAVGSADYVNDNRYAPYPVASQVIFYENEGFTGRTFQAEQDVESFGRYGFNDRASSVVVLGDRWEVCADNRFAGQCMVLRPGRYPSLSSMGMNDRISSVRTVGGNSRVDENRYAPSAAAVYDSRRRQDERFFEAPVTSARAVVGPAERRCWMAREEVPQSQGGPNVGGAVVGALIGGILGHQVGGGTGKDLATVGGAVAGAAVGANVNRGNAEAPRDVQRCENTPASTRPAYWDVSYTFRGEQHRVQMTTQPGATITVNGQGDPRT